MIELWVKPEGLRKGHDPHHPTINDISVTSRLAQLADRVILQTSATSVIVKNADTSQLSRYPMRVLFDGRSLEVAPHDPKDLAALAVMRKELKTKGGRIPEPDINNYLQVPIEEDDECPNCHNGTLEKHPEMDDVYVCRGECGAFYRGPCQHPNRNFNGGCDDCGDPSL